MRLFPRTARRRLVAAAAAGSLAIGAVTVPLAYADDLKDRQKNVEKQIKHADHDLEESSDAVPPGGRRSRPRRPSSSRRGRSWTRREAKLAAARIRDQQMQAKLAAAEERLARRRGRPGQRAADARGAARRGDRHDHRHLPGAATRSCWPFASLLEAQTRRRPDPARGVENVIVGQEDAGVRRPARRRGAARGPRGAGRGRPRRGRRAAQGRRRAPGHDGGADGRGPATRRSRFRETVGARRDARQAGAPAPARRTARSCAQLKRAGAADQAADPGRGRARPRAATTARPAASSTARCPGTSPRRTATGCTRSTATTACTTAPTSTPPAASPMYAVGRRQGDLALLLVGLRQPPRASASATSTASTSSVDLQPRDRLPGRRRPDRRARPGRRVRRQHRLVDRLPPALHGDGERPDRRPDELAVAPASVVEEVAQQPSRNHPGTG